LAEAAGVEVEADGYGGKADADLLAAECDGDAVDGIGRLGGAEGEGVAGLRLHA
jgi:hypothetical protein